MLFQLLWPPGVVAQPTKLAYEPTSPDFWLRERQFEQIEILRRQTKLLQIQRMVSLHWSTQNLCEMLGRQLTHSRSIYCQPIPTAETQNLTFFLPAARTEVEEGRIRIPFPQPSDP